MHVFRGPPSMTGTKYKTHLSKLTQRRKNPREISNISIQLVYQSDGGHSTMVPCNTRKALHIMNIRALNSNGGAPLVLQVDAHRARIGVLGRSSSMMNLPFQHCKCSSVCEFEVNMQETHSEVLMKTTWPHGVKLLEICNCCLRQFE